MKLLNSKSLLSGVVVLCATAAQAQVSVSSASTNVSCNGANDGTIDLTVQTGMAPFSFDWNTGSENEDLSNLPAGTYNVTVTDANGDMTTESVTITEPAVFEVSAGSDVTFCSGESAQLSATASGGTGTNINYLWLCDDPDCFFDDNTLADPTVTPPASRLYYVFATDENGCAAELDSVTVTVNQTPNLTISNDTSIVEGESVQLQVLPGWQDQYDWQPATYLDNTTIFSPTATPTETITYSVLVTSAAGCEAMDSVTVTVTPAPTVAEHTVNTLFTPNGDGANDFWMIHTVDDVAADVVVYNRWGKEVYAQRNYDNTWDGTSNGEQLPEATYYYVITIEGESESLKGPVSIVRLDR